MTSIDEKVSIVDSGLELGGDPVPMAPVARKTGRRNGDLLVLAWLHGTLQAAVFRRHVQVAAWLSPVPIHNLEEFEVGLDRALVAVGFGGTEVSLVLAHPQFIHQVEHAPAFSESAARTYLRGRVERHEKLHSPVLWISQQTGAVRLDTLFLLHLLPRAFYAQLNGVLLGRRLDLTRILPLAVPLQLVLDASAAPRNEPVILAVEVGDAIALLLGRVGGPLLLARTMLARWEMDASRIAVEVNRCLLYAKQQFGAVVTRVWLTGGAGEPGRAEVQARCGADKDVSLRGIALADLLLVVAKLSPRHPVNLVAGHLGRKRRLLVFRRGLLAACWLGLVFLSLDAWNRRSEARDDAKRFHGFHANEQVLVAERDRLAARNAKAETQRDFLRQLIEDRPPPMAARLLGYLGASLPSEIRLTDFTMKRDDATRAWAFRVEGTIEADDETARELLVTFQKRAAKSDLRVNFSEGSSAITPLVAVGADVPAGQRFSLEGSLVEK